MSVIITPGLGGSSEPEKGYADGFVVKYDTDTRVIVTAGVYEASGVLYTLSADTTVTPPGPLNAFQNMKTWLDTSASTPSAPVFYIDATTPAKNTVKNGWYHQSPSNTEDRLVGLLTFDSLKDFIPSEVTGRGQLISVEFGKGRFPSYAVTMAPNGNWQDPNAGLTSNTLPFNATRLRFFISNTNVGGLVTVYLGAAELSTEAVGTPFPQFQASGSESLGVTGVLTLGPSRDVKIAGDASNDNALSLFPLGYEYER